MKTTKGLSIWLAFGSWGGFGIYFGNPTLFRICLGWISFCILLMDIENTLDNCFQKLEMK